MDAARRYIEVLAFVALWMALGWIFHLDTNSYLLIGIPLVVLFQRFVRQRPLRQLWVRDAAAFRLGLVGIVIAVLLILAPGYDLIFCRRTRRSHGLLSCGFGAPWLALHLLPLQLLSSVQAPLAVPCPASFQLCSSVWQSWQPAPQQATTTSVWRFQSCSCYSSSSYSTLRSLSCSKEVAFRGALDSHIYQPLTGGQQRGGSAWLSAIFVSALWGIWHLPLLPTGSAAAFGAAIPVLIIVHTLTGVPLSFRWRASGTLVLPAAAHALIDSYRNCVQ